MKLRKGNVFTPVCDSVHRDEVYIPPDTLPGRHPLGRHPPRQAPSQADIPPQTDTPQADTPLGRPPPADSRCSRRYASYWNAFLFQIYFVIHSRHLFVEIT